MTKRPGVERAPRNLPLTVQGWFVIVLGVMVALVAIGAVVGSRLLSETTAASNRVSQHIEPAQAEAFRLQATLVDQETGVRGYALTGDTQFLEPYTDGQKSEAESIATIKQLLPDDSQVQGNLAKIEDAAAQWRSSYADPLIAEVAPGNPRPPDRTSASAAKAAFDQIRGLFQVQNDQLAAAKTASLDHLFATRAERDWVFFSMLVVFFVTAGLLVVLMQRLVIRPLEFLRRSSRRIAAGDFGHVIDENGPADLRALVRDVESMRERIMDELAASHAAQEQLREQTVVLDRRALELRRSNAELEQFAYVASHDLQEPLRKVASFCQLLERRYADALDERGKQYIDFAVDGAMRMQVLITDLLAFSRVGRTEDNLVPLALDDALDDALRNVETAIKESGATIERPDTLPEIVGDSTLVAQLWQNLIGNAIKFRTPDEPPRVMIAYESDAGSDDAWLLSVSDNGIGIPEEFAEKVFVIFQRLHGRDTYAGTGIGLALCKKIVDYHGGRIWLDTSQAAGTRICFTLPKTTPVRGTAALAPNRREGSLA